ncbi:MAG: TetR/AcrR family transcriptional regulator [Myxococcus sp.]|nr:TetR/AcrR family transcriptional regulator [Myxococcus sp.]
MRRDAEALGVEAWVEAAAAALAAGGVDAVRVEPLAARLGVTKGSFYWHFADRQALLDAVLGAWVRSATTAIIEGVEAAEASPVERLRALVDVTRRVDAGARLEQAVRAWGARAPEVRRRLEAVDAERVRYVQGLLVHAGLPKALAEPRARLCYLALIGEASWVTSGGAPSPPSVWRALLEALTAPAEVAQLRRTRTPRGTATADRARARR